MQITMVTTYLVISLITSGFCRPTQIQGLLEAALFPVRAVKGLIEAADDALPLVVKSTEDITSVLPLLESLRMAAVEAHQNKQKAVQTFSRSFLCHLSGKESCREEEVQALNTSGLQTTTENAMKAKDKQKNSR